jgi:hypothetical protein
MTEDEHELAVRYIAANRFPFPDQPHPSWPLHYKTTINTRTHRRNALDVGGTAHYPDIMIYDGMGNLREIAEIETHVSPDFLPRWRVASLAADDATPNKARHLLIYVPLGLEPEAERLLEENGISYHALRGIQVMSDGVVRILPYKTVGNMTDHRAHEPAAPEDDPILPEPDAAAHGAVVRFVGANRFPFPDQPVETWPIDYHTYLNTPLHGRRWVPGTPGPHYPDIVVVDGEGAIHETGEVEITVDEACLPRWSAASRAARIGRGHLDPSSGHKARRFFVYVPAGQEVAAEALLRGNAISSSGVRGYTATGAGRVTIVSEGAAISPNAT